MSVPSSAPPAPPTEVTIPLAGGGSLPAALALPEPAPEGRSAGVLVVHEALGLNADMRRIVARFAAHGYAALAPDFLAGLGPMPFCLARFMRGIGRVGRGRPYRQLDAARQWMAGRPEVDGSRIGVAGFCMGGGFALLYAAGRGSDAVRVAAPFYGPVPDDAGALDGVCPVVASYGGRDRVFGRAGARLASHLAELGVEHDVKTYPEAGHSFMSRIDGPLGWLARRTPIRAGYHEASAEDAWRRMLAFFGHHLAEAA
jgi:carboxymethylenebutenolidase